MAMTMQLETRECAGGCGLTFRCLASSAQVRARVDCGPLCGTKKHEDYQHPYRGKPRAVPPEQLALFDEVCATIAASLDTAEPLSFSRAFAARGVSVSAWSSLKKRITRHEPERAERALALTRRLEAVGIGRGMANDHPGRAS